MDYLTVIVIGVVVLIFMSLLLHNINEKIKYKKLSSDRQILIGDKEEKFLELTKTYNSKVALSSVDFKSMKQLCNRKEEEIKLWRNKVTVLKKANSTLSRKLKSINPESNQAITRKKE